jgi:HD-like signal output (HDOD) protein
MEEMELSDAGENLMVVECECGHRMKVPVKAAGRDVKCVKCAASIHVDAPGGAAAPRPPSGNPAEERPIVVAERTGTLLVKAGLITRDQLDEALALQSREGGKTFELLIRLGYLDKDQLHDFLSGLPGIATIDLKRFKFDRDLINLIPRELALENLVIPIDRLGKLFTVAMACPVDMVTIKEISRVTGLRVKAMLCRFDDIQAIVQKYYPGENGAEAELSFSELFPSLSGLEKIDIGPRIENLDFLTVDSAMVKRLRAVLGAGECAPRAIMEELETAPVFSAQLLRTANSAAYGMAGKVDNIALAMVLLGRDGVLRVLGKTPERDQNTETLNLCRERAVRCALAAMTLADSVDNNTGAGTAYTAGLIHELGRFALMEVSAESYSAIDPGLSGDELVKAETKRFTMAHPEAGAQLAGLWKLPENIITAIRHYLEPEKAGTPFADLVAAAAAAAAHPGATDSTVFAAREPSLKRIGVSMDALLRISAELAGEEEKEGD